MQEHEEQAKYNSSIIKLLEPLKVKVPINYYRRYAVDGNNFMGDTLQRVFQLLWKLHPDKIPSPQQKQQLTKAINIVVDQYLCHLKPLICSQQLRQNLWVVFDGLKLKHLVWPGAKKHTYYWPLLAQEANQKAPQNEKEKPEHFFYFLDRIYSAIKNTLQGVGVKVHIAPYQADSQIQKMYLQGLIDCALSEDYEFFHFGVPMVLHQFDKDHCWAIDLKLIKPQMLEDQLLKRWVSQADRQKKLMFSVLSGSKYMSHFRALSFRQIMQTVLDCSCLADFFKIANDKFKVPRIKNFRGTFEQTAGNLMILYQFQICYSFIKKQQQPLNSGGFERYLRQNKIKKGHNKFFNKVFSLIGDIVQKYDKDQRYRTGKIKLHNHKHRSKSNPVQGETIQQKIQYLYGNNQWINADAVDYIFPNNNKE